MCDLPNMEQRVRIKSLYGPTFSAFSKTPFKCWTYKISGVPRFMETEKFQCESISVVFLQRVFSVIDQNNIYSFSIVGSTKWKNEIRDQIISSLTWFTQRQKFLLLFKSSKRFTQGAQILQFRRISVILKSVYNL